MVQNASADRAEQQRAQGAAVMGTDDEQVAGVRGVGERFDGMDASDVLDKVHLGVLLPPDGQPLGRDLLGRHQNAWERLWKRARLDVDGPETAQIVRLHVFHLLQTLSPHTADLDAGVPARGLHGEAYRGHVFWDELFVLPWLDLRFPEISRALGAVSLPVLVHGAGRCR